MGQVEEPAMMETSRSLIVFATACLAAGLGLTSDVRAKARASDKVCELNWRTSIGDVGINRTYAADGTLKRERVGVFTGRIGDSYSIDFLSLDMQRGSDVSSKETDLKYELGYDFSLGVPKKLLVEIFTSSGPLSFTVKLRSGEIQITSEQLRQILETNGPVEYSVYRMGDTKRTVLRHATFDVGRYSAIDLAGLSTLAGRASAIFDTAMQAKDQPCANGEGPPAEENNLEIECKEVWGSALGKFEMDNNSVRWENSSNPGAALSGSFRFEGGPRVDRVKFIGNGSSVLTPQLIEEFRAGLARLQAKEMTPLTSCEMKVNHYTMEIMI